MSRMFRQAFRGAPRLFKQAGRDLDVFGRQLSNTTKVIGQGLGESRKILSDVEKGAEYIPVVGGVISGGARTIGQALKVGENLNSAANNIGMGLRAGAGGDVAGAVDNFGRAAGDVNAGINNSAGVFL